MDIVTCIEREEQGDSTIFSELFKDKVIYDHKESTWYLWNGHIWQRDDKQQVYNLTELVAETYQENMSALPSHFLKKCAYRIRRLHRLVGIRNCLELAKSKMSLDTEWDNDPFKLAVSNGVLNLQTGKLEKGKPDDYIRTTSEIEWKGLDEPAPRFEKFLEEIFDGNQEVIKFIQRLFGYAMTGLNVEHVLPIFYGPEGRNGKGVLLKIICHVLGNDLASPVSKEILLSGIRNPGASAPFLFELQDKRFVYAEETTEGAKFDEGQVKMLTGGTPFAAKELYHQPVTITPKYLLVMTTNSKPQVSADDPAIWERILLIEFTQRFMENPELDNERKIDKFLYEKLTEEASGILAWLVRGCMEWQKHKSLLTPQCVKYTTDAYKNDQDSIGRFLQDECEILNDAKVYASDLQSRYNTWATGDTKKMNRHEFSKSIRDKGFERNRDASGYYYTGLQLKPHASNSLEHELEAYLDN